MLSSLLPTVLVAFTLPGPTWLVPLAGNPPGAAAVSEIRRLPGVVGVETAEPGLRLQVARDQEVRLREIARVLAERAPGTSVDRDRLAIDAHTIFELDAGVCFFCAEKPLGQTLARKSFIERWSVVDYAPKGRLRFRVEPRNAASLAALGGDTFEDIILTARYDGRGVPDLYWPTGGVLWRKDQAAARREATASKKPLMIFPTAGT